MVAVPAPTGVITTRGLSVISTVATAGAEDVAL